MKRLLLVEDEPGLVLTLTDRLTREGYDVQSTADGESALARATEAFDLVLLDVMLPRLGGFDVVRELRRQSIETPVIMLTARGQVVDKVVGLKLGADDYVTKPFEMVELLARIEAKLRHVPAKPHPAEGHQFGDIQIDFRRAEVTRGAEPLELSAREFQLLRYFIEHRGATLTREELLNECGATMPCRPHGQSTCTWHGCVRKSSPIPVTRNSSSPCTAWGTSSRDDVFWLPWHHPGIYWSVLCESGADARLSRLRIRGRSTRSHGLSSRTPDPGSLIPDLGNVRTGE